MWQSAKQQADARSKASLLTAHKRREALLKQARELPIAVEKMENKRLLRAAIDNYNAHNGMGNELRREFVDEFAIDDGPRAFLLRIQVNFARHRLTPYDRILSDFGGKVGVHDSASCIRQRVLSMIGEAYPWLREECERQSKQVRD